MAIDQPDPTNTGGSSGGASGSPSWLPPGATINPDGSITLSNGTVIPAPGPGMTRDPNTGVLTAQPGSTATSTDYLPGGTYGPQYPPAPTTQTTTPPPTGGGGGGGGPTANPMIQPFTAPPPVSVPGSPTPGTPYIPPTPVFNAPQFNAPAPLNLPQFQAPSPTSIYSDPSFQFREQQGLGAISNNQAAQGLWGTGATGKAMQDYAQNFASQEYGNIYNRALQSYNTNIGTDLNQYMTNAQFQNVLPYQAQFAGAQAQFAPQMTAYSTQAAAGANQNQLNYSNAYNKWVEDFNQRMGLSDLQLRTLTQ